MSGLGRRTHYRKHLTDSVLHDFPEPQSDEKLAKVVATRGGNQFDILVAAADDDDDHENDHHVRESQLAILPTKFRKLVWVKRNDYVIVQTGNGGGGEQDDGKGGIRFIINHILYCEQVNHLKSQGHWPTNDPEFQEIGRVLSNVNDGEQDDEEEEEHDDGIVYENTDDELFVNNNHLAALKVQDSSSSSDNDADDED